MSSCSSSLRESEIPNAFALIVGEATKTSLADFHLDPVREGDQEVGVVSITSTKLAVFASNLSDEIKEAVLKMKRVRNQQRLQEQLRRIDDMCMKHRIVSAHLIAQMHTELNEWDGSHLLQLRYKDGKTVAVISERTRKLDEQRFAALLVALSDVREGGGDDSFFTRVVQLEHQLFIDTLGGRIGGPLA